MNLAETTPNRSLHAGRRHQASVLPQRLRRPARRPQQPRLLRPQTSRRQEAQRGPDLSRQTSLRRHTRHAPQPPALPAPHRRCRLTPNIGTPPTFADPHSPWQRPSNENTNGLIREYIPKGEVIPAHQPYLTSIAEELNERPRQALGFLTPRESFERLLLGQSPVASTA